MSAKQPVLDAVIVLAAGRSRRMAGETPKVLKRLAGAPMIAHVIRAVEPLQAHQILCVLPPPPHGTDIHSHIPTTVYVPQDKPLGTADAVSCAVRSLPSLATGAKGDTLILFGDTPLVETTLLRELLAHRHRTDAGLVLAAVHEEPPCDYGRLITNAQGHIERIVEAHNATPEQYALTLNNGGIFVVKTAHLAPLLHAVTQNPKSGEYDLTQIVQHATQKTIPVNYLMADSESLHGVNTLSALAQAESLMQMRLRQRALDNGVQLIDPSTTTLSYDSQFGTQVTLEPHVVIGTNVRIGDRSTIRAFSSIEGAQIDTDATIGPYARIRPSSIIGTHSRIGNFVEIKNARIGKHTNINHLSYIGDATVGDNVNIGAGVITCNYDGKNKHTTIIEDNAFIGSNCALIAPLTIEKKAVVAAGSTLTQDVPSGALGVARCRQKTIPRYKRAP
ncbi:MAG: bifunctional UDP-N-acetylglucosamine diphosphorylase/glucosamine-1-phosphate N-acetyltransferase GlmU [Alphaproteobacteria bacterium GM202ARS2]|nr:bifunctional UDP-N-acetylglucosamine diphosphorylase/glucosamine-1-phosphate N-acetyltransferase GlmU [Alphaproteobacteria bacterium GM202ARS2]